MSEAIRLRPGPELADDDPRALQRVLQGNFVLTLQSSDQRGGTLGSLQLTGPIYVGEEKDPKAVHDRIDFYQGLIDRQRDIAEIRRKEEFLAAELANVNIMFDQNEVLTKRAKAGERLVTVEKDKLENYTEQVRNRKQVIERLQTEIAALKKKVGL